MGVAKFIASPYMKQLGLGMWGPGPLGEYLVAACFVSIPPIQAKFVVDPYGKGILPRVGFSDKLNILWLFTFLGYIT